MVSEREFEDGEGAMSQESRHWRKRAKKQILPSTASRRSAPVMLVLDFSSVRSVTGF